ncbi:hypothetical protein JCM8547_000879 [Rhodosporidiobolus lusitaniae]
MTLDSHFTTALRVALDSPSSTLARSPPPPLQLSSPNSPSKPRSMRPSPPRLVLGAPVRSPLQIVQDNGDEPDQSSGSGSSRGRPSLTIQPASPAMSSTATFGPSPTEPFPPPIPSTSTSPHTPSFQPFASPTPQPLPSSLAARRAAKLGKKRLSLVVPTAAHANGGSSLLSPASPGGFLRPTNDLDDAETRSLPPSPVSLTTFIGTEGTEAPDRTIGRLMLKQQADEMREQMRGGRGMKRRTSIPRLNLVAGGAAAAKPTGLDNLVPSSSSSTAAAGGAGKEGASVVQLIRADSYERRGSEGVQGDMEEFPYALGPREILPGMFLGSEQNAKDPAVLRDWRIGFVLNVAKEVDCPWMDETIEEDGGEEEEQEEVHQLPTPIKAASRTSSSSTITSASPHRPVRPKHRRTKTHAAAVATVSSVEAVPPAAPAAPAPPTRPPFIRPTASTPNLHAVYNPTSRPPPVPSIPSIYLASSGEPLSPAGQGPNGFSEASMQRSLSSSPPVPRRSPPRPLRRAPAPALSSTTTSTRSPAAIRIPSNARTGRPALEYLWLKWGHDESDLVEAKKFQSAFDFLDEARERGERVLVHCQCGVSRSATVVIAYCMREAAKAIEEGRDAEALAGCTGMHDTYSFVKEKSEWVGPNLSLVFQLVAYERTLRGDTLDGDEDGEEPPYPHYPPEPPSPEAPFLPTLSSLSNGISHPTTYDEHDDAPPPPPSASFASFTFPAPLKLQPHQPDSQPFPALRSPRTPVSESSIPGSQLSTPELHDPLISPTFSSGTKASSVTSTPLSVVEPDGAVPHPVRVVGADVVTVNGNARDRHSSMDTVVAEEEHGRYGVGGAGHEDDKPVFFLPAPPTRLRDGHSPHPLRLPMADATSPTVAFHPRPRPQAPTLSLSVPVSPAVLSSHFSSPSSAATSSGGTVASPPALSPTSNPPPPSSSETAFSPLSAFSPSSTISASSPHPSMVSSTSSTSLASISSSLSNFSGTSSTLSRTNSARARFGANQTPQQRRASHRRVFSVENPRFLASSSSSGGTMGGRVGSGGSVSGESEGEEGGRR